MSFVEKREGREFARAMFAEIADYPATYFKTDGVTTVLANLEVTVTQYRGDYRVGIEEILCIAREAVSQ